MSLWAQNPSGLWVAHLMRLPHQHDFVISETNIVAKQENKKKRNSKLRI